MAVSRSEVRIPGDSEMGPAAHVPGQTSRFNESWRVFYEKWGNVIRCYARQKGLDEHSAEDVLALVMMKVFRAQLGQVAGYDPDRGPFKAWLWGVVRYSTREVLRNRKEQLMPRHADKDDDSTSQREIRGDEPDRVDEADERRWRNAILAEALRRLRDGMRPENFEIFMALFKEKGRPEELAKAYQKTPNNIYQIHKRSLEKLKAEANAIVQELERGGHPSLAKGTYG